MIQGKKMFGALCTAAIVAAGTAPTPAAEFRGLWVDAWHAGFRSSTEVSTLVSRCKTYNFNAVIVQMRRRGDAWYIPQAPNEEPRTTALPSGFDALQEIINQCHASTPRIEVHCWVPTHLIWSDSTAPTQSGHVYNAHPEYLMKNSTGATYISEGYYIDPGHPGTGQWNYNMAKDIVSRYNIDGFHWDYIRYPTTDSGYNSTAIARFNAEFGRTGQPSTTDSTFSDWRRRQVTDFLRWTNADLLAIKPQIHITASVFASRSDAYNARFQDWAAWANEGILDILMPMNYTADNTLFNSRINDIYNNQGVRRAYIGQGAYLNSPSNTVTQCKAVRNKPFLGYQLYSYAVPNSGTVNQTNTFSYIKTNLQPTYTGTPTLPWKTNPTKGIIKGTITATTGGAIYNANVTISTSPNRSQLTEPHGKYAFFEVPAGTYTITASATGKATKSGTISVTAGSVATLNLALADSTGGNEIIVDNPSATVVGSWTLATSATDKYGADYRYKGQGTGADYVQFTPSIGTAGTYTVSEWHSQGSNRSSGTPHAVTHANGTSTVNINQQTNGGLWNLVGTYSFNTGTSGYVRIKDNIPTSGYVAIADAIKFSLAAPADITVDNTSSNFSASSNWSMGTSATDKYGSDYRYRSTAATADACTWTFNIPVSGSYESYAWWSQGSNRSASAPYIVYHSSGSTTVNKNQQTNGGSWQSLGIRTHSAGSNKIELSCWTTTGYVVIGDAIKLVAR